jgi:hypothetical protein
MDKIFVYFESNLVGTQQYIRMGVDDKVYAELPLPLNTCSFECKLNEGQHSFWLELCNKDSDNESRVQGSLNEDTYIKIKNLSVNGSMMNHLLNDCGHIVVDWEHHSDVAKWFLENKGEIPKQLNNSNYLNLKGTYYFNFYTPIDRFLNDKIPIDKNYQKMYNPNLDRFRQLKNKLVEEKEC